MIPTVCALSSLSLEMNSRGSDGWWAGGGQGVCVCVDSEGGQWAQEGVASLEMVNRIIKRNLVLPRRQK